MSEYNVPRYGIELNAWGMVALVDLQNGIGVEEEEVDIV